MHKGRNIGITKYLSPSEVYDNDRRLVRRYRKRILKNWQRLGAFDVTKQTLCDKASNFRESGWLSELELHVIRRETSNEIQDEHNTEERTATNGMLEDEH